MGPGLGGRAVTQAGAWAGGFAASGGERMVEQGSAGRCIGERSFDGRRCEAELARGRGALW